MKLIPLSAMVLTAMTGGALAQSLDGGSLPSLRATPTLSLDALGKRKASPDTPRPTGGASSQAAGDAGASDLRAPAASEMPTSGADATPLPTLLEAAERAAVNRAAVAGVDAARAQEQQAWRSAWMPRLDASASRVQQKIKLTSSLTGQPDAESRTSGPATNMALSASLPVWRAAERAAARAQASLTEQTEWQARSQRINTAREVCLAYIGAAESNEQRRLAEAQQQLLQEQLHINDRRLDAGMGTVLDQLETRTRLDQTRASVQELVMRATSQRLSLERLAARPVQLPAGFNPDTAKTRPELPTLEEALALADQHNPAIRDARAALDAARLTSDARDADFWQPTVDAVASVQKERTTASAGDISQTQSQTNRSVGVQLNWPLFSGGVQQSRVKEASALLSQAQARLDDAQGQVQTGLRDAYQNLYQAQAIIASQQDVEATATATFEAVRKAFVAGMRTNIDLLNAQQQIYSARQNVVAARVTALSAQIAILALLDRLDGGQVGPMAVHFDAQALSSKAVPATSLSSLTPASSLSTPSQVSR